MGDGVTGETTRDRVGVIGSVLVFAMSAALVGLLVRVAQLQTKPMGELDGASLERTRATSVAAPRGDLVDRRGRVLATTRFGYRAFVDPVTFPEPPDLAILPLAAAVGERPDVVAERVLSRIEINRRRLADTVAGGEAPESAELIRYVVVSDMLSEERVAAVRALDVPGVYLEQRAVRVDATGGLASSLVGKVGFEGRGLVGAEHLLDRELVGEPGRIRFVHDARGRAIWIHNGEFEPAERGEDVTLSIDLECQRIAREELRRGVEEAEAAGGRLVMIDTLTGEIIAMSDLVREPGDVVEIPWVDEGERGARVRTASLGAGGSDDERSRPRYRAVPRDPLRELEPALGRNRCVEDVYEPGSTFKPIVWAIVTELGRVEPGEVIETHGGRWRTAYGRALEDVTKRETMTWEEVLFHSSNIGMAQAVERLSHEELRQGLKRFGFGERVGLALPGEASGLMTSARDWSKYTQTSVSFGYEVAVTPVQMVRAFGAFARPGAWAGTLPHLTLRARSADEGEVLHRVLPREVAEMTRAQLARVAEAMERKLARRSAEEDEWRYRIFGKSGTAKIAISDVPEGKRRPPGFGGYLEGQYVSSFVAGGPLEEPRVAVIVVIDDPGPGLVRERRYYGSDVAGPVVRRVLERVLAYLGVEPSPAEPE